MVGDDDDDEDDAPDEATMFARLDSVDAAVDRSGDMGGAGGELDEEENEEDPSSSVIIILSTAEDRLGLFGMPSNDAAVNVFVVVAVGGGGVGHDGAGRTTDP